MPTTTRQTVFVDREVLATVEQMLRRLVRQGVVSAVALVDTSGAILVSAGDLPAPADEMGATAAGIFGAIRTVLPCTVPQDFTVKVRTNAVGFHFREVADRLFLCSFSMAAGDEQQVAVALDSVARQAQDLLATTAHRKPSSRTLEALSEKLEELFSSFKNTPRQP